MIEYFSNIELTPEMMTALTLLTIVALRIVDVSAGVLRVMFLVRYNRWRAGLAGFVASLTWLFAAAAVLGSMDTPLKAIAYAGGYAAGTVIGAWIEERLAVGNVVLRIFVTAANPSPATMLRDKGWGVTEIPSIGRHGPVTILFSVVPRKQVKQVIQTVAEQYPRAYITVESIATIDPTHRKFQNSRK